MERYNDKRFCTMNYLKKLLFLNGILFFLKHIDSNDWEKNEEVFLWLTMIVSAVKQLFLIFDNFELTVNVV